MPISHFTFSCFPLSLSLAPAALSTRSIAPSLPAHGPPLGLSPHTHPLPPGRLPHGQAGYLERPRCPVISMEKGLWHPADSTPRPSPTQIFMWLKRFSCPVCRTHLQGLSLAGGCRGVPRAPSGCLGGARGPLASLRCTRASSGKGSFRSLVEDSG